MALILAQLVNQQVSWAVIVSIICFSEVKTLHFLAAAASVRTAVAMVTMLCCEIPRPTHNWENEEAGKSTKLIKDKKMSISTGFDLILSANCSQNENSKAFLPTDLRLNQRCKLWCLYSKYFCIGNSQCFSFQLEETKSQLINQGETVTLTPEHHNRSIMSFCSYPLPLGLIFLEQGWTGNKIWPLQFPFEPAHQCPLRLY